MVLYTQIGLLTPGPFIVKGSEGTSVGRHQGPASWRAEPGPCPPITSSSRKAQDAGALGWSKGLPLSRHLPGRPHSPSQPDPPSVLRERDLHVYHLPALGGQAGTSWCSSGHYVPCLPYPCSLIASSSPKHELSRWMCPSLSLQNWPLPGPEPSQTHHGLCVIKAKSLTFRGPCSVWRPNVGSTPNPGLPGQLGAQGSHWS